MLRAETPFAQMSAMGDVTRFSKRPKWGHLAVVPRLIRNVRFWAKAKFA